MPPVLVDVKLTIPSCGEVIVRSKRIEELSLSLYPAETFASILPDELLTTIADPESALISSLATKLILEFSPEFDTSIWDALIFP